MDADGDGDGQEMGRRWGHGWTRMGMDGDGRRWVTAQNLKVAEEGGKSAGSNGLNNEETEVREGASLFVALYALFGARGVLCWVGICYNWWVGMVDSGSVPMPVAWRLLG